MDPDLSCVDSTQTVYNSVELLSTVICCLFVIFYKQTFPAKGKRQEEAFLSFPVPFPAGQKPAPRFSKVSMITVHSGETRCMIMRIMFSGTATQPPV